MDGLTAFASLLKLFELKLAPLLGGVRTSVGSGRPMCATSENLGTTKNYYGAKGEQLITECLVYISDCSILFNASYELSISISIETSVKILHIGSKSKATKPRQKHQFWVLPHLNKVSLFLFLLPSLASSFNPSRSLAARWLHSLWVTFADAVLWTFTPSRRRRGQRCYISNLRSRAVLSRDRNPLYNLITIELVLPTAQCIDRQCVRDSISVYSPPVLTHSTWFGSADTAAMEVARKAIAVARSFMIEEGKSLR